MKREHPNVHWIAHHLPDVLVVLAGIYLVLWVASS